jgi:hypothetical protein
MVGSWNWGEDERRQMGEDEMTIQIIHIDVHYRKGGNAKAEVRGPKGEVKERGS